MRWWWLIALVACESKPAAKPPDPAPLARPIDAAIDAPVMTPQAGEVAVPPGFYIDKTEVTIADYRACVAAKACSRTSRGDEIHGKDPRVAMGGVTFYQARAYCAWKGKRLPTPAEWKRAAYGDGPRKYPWGDDPPTCERAWFASCAGQGPTVPGRPAGASPVGALDMIGNVAEWTDPGPVVFANACVDPPRGRVPVLGGAYGSRGDSPHFERDNLIADSTTWFDNSDLGIRCARSAVPEPAHAGPVPSTWLVTPFARAKDAILEVERRCKAGAQVGLVAGELVGLKGWAVIDPAGTVRVTVPPDLVRVVGLASCDFADTMKLTVKTDQHAWKLEMPTEIGVYQMWLPRGTWATFDLDCKPPPDRGECSFAMVKTNPATFLVPDGPASGVEGPALEASGGMTCD